jgi:MATE family multidrug resistance protein
LETKTTTRLQVQVTNRQILKIALPITLALLVPQVNFITNNIFLSGLGETELATAGITGVFYLVFALVGNGLNSGLQGLLARRAGENRPGEIGRLFAQGMWIAMFFALAGIIITYAACPYFLHSTLHSEKVYTEAVSFLRIRAWGIPFLYLFQVCNALLVSTSNSKYMKFGFWTQAIVNIFLDYALIYGHFGLPQVGFNGAAYASVIAEVAGMVVVLGIIFYKRFSTRFNLFSHLSFDRERAGLIFRQSSPLVAQFLISILAWLLFYLFIEHMGERPLAISNTMRNLFGMLGIFVWAFASTTNAMVSNIIGQGKNEEVLTLIRKIMKLSMCFTVVLCLAINIFPSLFLNLYGRGQHFIDDAIPVVRMVSLGIIAMSVATVWLNAVTGTGHTRINLTIEAVAIVFYVIYIYLVRKVWDLNLVWAWASELIYWAVLFILSFLYLNSGKWKRKVI